MKEQRKRESEEQGHKDPQVVRRHPRICATVGFPPGDSRLLSVGSKVAGKAGARSRVEPFLQVPPFPQPAFTRGRG